MSLPELLKSYCAMPLVNELTWLGITTVGVDPTLGEDREIGPGHQAIVDEFALPNTTPLVTFPFGSLQLRRGAMGRPDNRVSQIRATGWAVYRGSATLPSVMGKLLLARLLAGAPVTLIRATAEAVLTLSAEDMGAMSKHQRNAVRHTASRTRDGFGPFIIAIDVDDERSFACVQADDRFFSLVHPDFCWAEEPRERRGR